MSEGGWTEGYTDDNPVVEVYGEVGERLREAGVPADELRKTFRAWAEVCEPVDEGEGSREAVLGMIERALDRNPDVTNLTLYRKAVRIDPDIRHLTTRQFHARYALQVKRERVSRGNA